MNNSSARTIVAQNVDTILVIRYMITFWQRGDVQTIVANVNILANKIINIEEKLL